MYVDGVIVMDKSLRNKWIWGFTTGAENWNGRLAMLAFIFVFLFELFTGQSIVMLIGF
jgi:hypothetical protein